MFTFTNADAIATLAEDNGQLLRGENIFAIGCDVLAVNAERVWFFRSQLCVVQSTAQLGLWWGLQRGRTFRCHDHPLHDLARPLQGPDLYVIFCSLSRPLLTHDS